MRTEEWVGGRAEVANWQRALAAEAFGAAAAEASVAVGEATRQFEAAHLGGTWKIGSPFLGS